MVNMPGFQTDKRSTFRNDPLLDSRLHLESGFGSLHVSCRWFCWKRLLIYLPGTILLLFFSIFILASNFETTFRTSKLEIDWLLLLTWLAMLIAGLWGLYQVLAVLLNHTNMEINSGTLSVRHGPLPFPGNFSIHYRDLKEFRTEPTIQRGLFIFIPAEGYAGDLVPKATLYRLTAILTNGRELALVDGPQEDTVHYLENMLTAQMQIQEYDPAKLTDVVPDGLEAQPGFGSLKYTSRWFSWKKEAAYITLVIMLLATARLYYSQNGFQPPDSFFGLVILLASPFVAFYCIYELLVTALNSTTIEISRERVTIHHGPLPYPGNKTVACREIDKLAITEREEKSDRPRSYELAAYLKDGRRIVLWSHASRETLAYLERQIGRQLPGASLF